MPRGGPYKLTTEVRNRICGFLRAGAYLKHAAEAAGIRESTVHDWLTKGEQEDAEEPYASFAVDVRTAQAEDAVRSIAAISKAETTGDWRAAAWKLERKYPREFALTHRLEHSGRDGKPLVGPELIDAMRKVYGEDEP